MHQTYRTCIMSRYLSGDTQNDILQFAADKKLEPLTWLLVHFQRNFPQ